MDKPILYNYFRSSTSIRIRVALNIKGIDFEYMALHLRKNEHKSEKYLKNNPFGLLPTIEFTNGGTPVQANWNYRFEIIYNF